MKSQFIVAIAGLVTAAIVAFSGCSKSPQQVQPAAQGQRGEACQARNDCASGLACIRGVCAKNEFNIAPQAKVCDQIDCTTTPDCCGDRPTAPGPNCANYQSVCKTPSIPGCLVKSCTSATDCAGAPCAGTCSNSFSTKCSDDSTCIAPAGSCSVGRCTTSPFNTCTLDADCNGTCQNKFCSCTNPAYNPLDTMCTDPTCTDVCTLICNSNHRCIQNNQCKTDTDCRGTSAPVCSIQADTKGQCVQCDVKTDCTTGVTPTQEIDCIDHVCKKPCKVNEECPIFNRCDATSGKCVYQGCISNTECILYYAGLANATGPDDARLVQCLPSDADPTKNVCKVPCENDAGCAEFESCVSGYCKFIGCKDAEECRAYLNLQDQVTTDTKPYISTAVCVDPKLVTTKTGPGTQGP